MSDWRRPVALLGDSIGPLPGVLLVSPPVAPPWLNGTSVLVRDLAAAGSAFRYHVMGYRGQSPPGGRAIIEPVYGSGDGPRMLTLGRLMARLLRPDRCAIHHYFFAPHPRAVRVARIATALPWRRSVHTVPSQPAEGADLSRLVFADRTVVMTEATAVRFRSAGARGIEVIRPAVDIPERPLGRPEARARLAMLGGAELAFEGDQAVFVYPGDLAFSDGARTFVEAAILAAPDLPEAIFVLACRSKTPSAARVLDELRRRVQAAGIAERVRFVGVVPDMHALLGAATAVVLPVDTLYAKVDTPIVVLEALAQGTPAVLSDVPQLGELAALGEGILVTPRSDSSALAERLRQLAQSPSLVRRLGDGARRTVASHFRPDQMAGAYEALYREVLDA